MKRLDNLIFAKEGETLIISTDALIFYHSIQKKDLWCFL